MNKQRIAILLCSVLGLFSVFMPWAHTIIPGLKNLNGMSRHVGNGGWCILILFAIPFVLSLLGKQTAPLKKTPYYTVIGAGLFIFFVVIIEMIRFKFGGGLRGTIASLGWGLTVVSQCGLCLSIVTFALRGKSEISDKDIRKNKLEEKHELKNKQ